MELDPVLLARIQFAFTVSFHIIFPTFTIGVAAYLATLEVLWGWTGAARYKRCSPRSVLFFLWRGQLFETRWYLPFRCSPRRWREWATPFGMVCGRRQQHRRGWHWHCQLDATWTLNPIDCESASNGLRLSTSPGTNQNIDIARASVIQSAVLTVSRREPPRMHW